MDNIIVDLDGTLALERHRRPLIKQGWRHYFSSIHLDPVNASVLRFLDLASESHIIHIFTSRPERYRRETNEWLDRHSVPYSSMEMRQPTDTNLDQGGWQTKRTDVEVKLDMLIKYKIGPSNTLCVLEDRDEMVNFYRAMGYDCWQVHPQHEMFVPDEILAEPTVQNV